MNTAALFQAIQHGNVEARGFCDMQRESGLAGLRMSCIASPIAVDVLERIIRPETIWSTRGGFLRARVISRDKVHITVPQESQTTVVSSKKAKEKR